MIARIWHGVTPITQADAYSHFLQTVGLSDYQSIPGNQGAFLLRRQEGEQAHFLMLSLWESEEAIRLYAGADITEPKYTSVDKQFLLELEPKVSHYEVFALP